MATAPGFWQEALLSDSGRAFIEKLGVTCESAAKDRFSGCKKMRKNEGQKGLSQESECQDSELRGEAFSVCIRMAVLKEAMSLEVTMLRVC